VLVIATLSTSVLRELAHRSHLLAQPGCRVQPRVRRPGGRAQRGDAYEPVAGPAEHGLGGDRQGGAARGDHLVDRECAEDAEGDRDVDGRRDPQRDVDGAVKVTTPKPRKAKKVRATLDTMSRSGG
jgi:hypothetical protein